MAWFVLFSACVLKQENMLYVVYIYVKSANLFAMLIIV